MYILIAIWVLVAVGTFWFFSTRNDDSYVTSADIERQQLNWNKHLAHMEKLGIDTRSR